MLFSIKYFIKKTKSPFIIFYNHYNYKPYIFENFANYYKISLGYLNFIKKKHLFSHMSFMCNSRVSTISKYTNKIVISNCIYLFYKYFTRVYLHHFKLFKDILMRENNIKLLIMNISIPKIIFLKKLIIQKILRNYNRFKFQKYNIM